MGQTFSPLKAEELWRCHAAELARISKIHYTDFRRLMPLELDKILDELGYNEERVLEQRLTHTKYDRAATVSCRQHIKKQRLKNTFNIMAGSQREGTSLFVSSDYDLITVYAFSQGFESHEHDIGSISPAYLMDTGTDVPAGYCMLKAINDKTIRSLVKVGDDYYLPSEKTMKILLGISTTQQFSGRSGSIGYDKSRQGPSTPMTMESKNTAPNVSHGDHVHALPCHCPSILKAWRQRARPHDWPGQDVVDHVASMLVFVVPIGQRGHENEALQWRLCFTMGEMRLVHSFNNTQLKVYMLLKLILKFLLKPFSDEITSFMLKNVLFWLSEELPTEKFKPDTLLERLTDALVRLRNCIINRQLKYYIIPERNLLLGKLENGIVRSLLVTRLNQIIKNYGQNFLGSNLQNLECCGQLFLKLYAGNQYNRMDVCSVSVATGSSLGHDMTIMREGFQSNFAALRFTLRRFFLIELPCLFKYGLKFLRDPLSIEHSAIDFTDVDLDFYDEWICQDCQVKVLDIKETEV